MTKKRNPYAKTMRERSALWMTLHALSLGSRYAGLIAEATGVDTKRVFAYLQTLERRGNVRRREAPAGEYGRRVRWTITAKGRRALAGAARSTK